MELRLRRSFPLSAQLIGVDGGATEVKTHEIGVVTDQRGARLVLGERSAHVLVPKLAGFVTPAEQEFSADNVLGEQKLGELGHVEREQGWAWVEATAEAILRVTREREAKNVLVGIAMPGVKTRDGRGIAFALNGPRVPSFLDDLEHRLAGESIRLLAPFFPLLGDGLCCGLGEQYGEGGWFHDVDNAYYVGGGTGVAEALKLHGQLVETDDFEDIFPRAWKLREPFEQLGYDVALSATGINRQYAARARLRLERADLARPEERVGDDFAAREIFELTGRRLASLVALRAQRLRQGWVGTSELREPIDLRRVVVGQRLGALLADERTRPWFLASFRAELERLLPIGDDEERMVVRTSNLRAAPAIGAAASALIAWDRAHA